MTDDPANDLNDCREQVAQLQGEKKGLQQENEQLRESADTFGELAERLAEALKEERLVETPPAVQPMSDSDHDS
jgi:F0F1-type ATP synthase membrane subunit b/b'